MKQEYKRSIPRITGRYRVLRGRPPTYINPVFIGIQADIRGAVAVLSVVKLHITLGALFRHIRRGDNSQNSRY